MSVMLTLDVPRQKGVKVERQYWNEMVTRIRARDTVTITEEAECCLIVLNYGQASLLDLETGQTVMIELLPDGEAKAEITGGTGNDFPTLKHLIVGPCYDLRSYLFHILVAIMSWSSSISCLQPRGWQDLMLQIGPVDGLVN